MTDNAEQICLRNVSVSYDDGPPVLDEVNFSLHTGERVGLVGHIGSGKTTLLHVIVGLLKPTAGEVEVFGQLRTREADFRDVRSRVGLLFQDPEDQLFCPTVREDIAFGPLNQGRTAEEVGVIVRDTLERVGLTGYEERITHHLSGGEKRLVSLASVLAMQPEVLLLDEPTNGLDEDALTRILELLAQLDQSLIIASHDERCLAALSQRRVVLRDSDLHAVD